MKLSSLGVFAGVCSLLIGSAAAATNIFTIGTGVPVGGTNSWPGGEPPGAAIDANNGTKYLNFGKTNTGYVFSLTAGTATASGINFVTGNDAEERDPASYILYGSNSIAASSVTGSIFDVTANFTEISNGALALPSGRGTAGGNVTFSSTTAYNTFLLVFPTVKNAGTANSMQIAEARIQTSTGDLSNEGLIGGGQLSEIPEPSATVLTGLGMLGLLTRRRSRSA